MCPDARNVSQSATSFEYRSVGLPFGIRQLAKDRAELASEGVEVLHRRDREPHELLDVLDLGRRTLREPVGERSGLHLQLDEALERAVAQLLGERAQRSGRVRGVEARV